MAQVTTDKKKEVVKKQEVRHGIPCSEKELKESEKCWKDMEDCFALLDKQFKKDHEGFTSYYSGIPVGLKSY